MFFPVHKPRCMAFNKYHYTRALSRTFSKRHIVLLVRRLRRRVFDDEEEEEEEIHFVHTASNGL